jgi:deazaflavin-dependent oxidoreductase (nitroreductase family)
MNLIQRLPRYVWRVFHYPPRIAYALGLGPLLGRRVLLLTTRGRNTGKSRVTPLQYEEIDGCFYLAAARGEKTDWLRNLAVHPEVSIQVGSRRLAGKARIMRDPRAIADFLELRLERHPLMISTIMRSAGMPRRPTRTDLEAYAAGRPLVVIRPAAPAESGERG